MDCATPKVPAEPSDKFVAAANIASGKALQIAEPDFSGTKRVPQIIGTASTELAAEFKTVLADHVGRAVGELQSLIWRGVKWPGLIPAKYVRGVESTNTNLRHPEFIGSVTPVFKP